MRLQTQAVHVGHEVDTASGAIARPINLSITFERDGDGSYPRGYFYSSKGNPNRNGLEAAFAALEAGKVAVAFASGCAAITAVLRTLQPGDHVIIPDDVFQGTVRILREVLAKWQITYSSIDLSRIASVEPAFRPNTKLVWMETLSNPLLKVTDLKAVSDIAHSHGALSVVDNSFVTPIFQQPLHDGVDLVVHAATKYIGGHGDVLGGVVVAAEAGPLIDEIRQIQWLEGAVPSPFDCWLIHRGIQTLPCRMRAHAANALAVAQALEGHRSIAAVHYPGLKSHPHHALANRQLVGGYGGIVSVQVRGGRDVAIAVCRNVKIFKNATSFGTTESLIQHQASSPTHGTSTGLAEDLLRLSVGLEHPDDLIEDINQALATAEAL